MNTYPPTVRRDTYVANLLKNIFWPLIFISWVPFATLDGIVPWDRSGVGLAPILQRNFPEIWFPVASVMAVLVVLSVAISPKWKPRLMAAAPLILLLVDSWTRGGVPKTFVANAYIFTFFISLAFFAAESTVKSYFWGFIVLLAIDVLLAGLPYPVTLSVTDWILGPILNPFLGVFGVVLPDFNPTIDSISIFRIALSGYMPSTVGIVLLVLVAVAARSLYLLIRQNIAGFRAGVFEQDKTARIAELKQAILLWWPMPAIFVILAMLYGTINKNIVVPCIVAELQGWNAKLHNSMVPVVPEQNVEALSIVSGDGTTRDVTGVMSLIGDPAFKAKMPEVSACSPSETDMSVLYPPTAIPATPAAPEGAVQGETPSDGAAPNTAESESTPVQSTPEPSPPEMRVPTISETMEILTITTEKVMLHENTLAKAASSRKIAESGESAEAGVYAGFDSLPVRFPGTETKKCRWYDIGCLLANGVKSTANSFYVKQKRQLEAKVISDFGSARADKEADAQEAVSSASDSLNSGIVELSGATRAAIGRLSLSLRILGVVLTAYSLLVLAKSFLIVLARVIYNSRPIHPLRLAKDSIGKAVKPSGSVFTIDPKSQDRLYIRRGAIGLNVIEKLRLPHWRSAIISRIWNGCYYLSYIDGASLDEPCDIRLDSPAELVVWDITPGQEVVFSFADFVGMSEDILLKRYVSLRLGSLVFGRVFYQCARGRGKLILRTHAKAITGEDGFAASSFHSGGLIGWSSNNEYFVKSSLTKMDVFFSGCNLRKTPGNVLAYDTSQLRRKDGVLSGIWRMIGTFLLPF